MTKRKSREILLYFIPPLITVAAILIIYALKGQYPFGTGTMMDNDWGVADFPGFVRFWDVAHGKKSLLFDWSTALGLPKSAIGYFFWPVNYLLLLFKRDFLYEAMNYYYIAQMAAISVTSFAFFRNVFKKLPLYYTYLFSFAFTFCGFNLQYYTNINWLSAIAVFPLVALAAYKMLAERKCFVFYTLILAYSLIISSYLTFFMLEGIVLIGTLYVFCFLSKEERKGAAFRLGTGTAWAFLISLWTAFGFMSSTVSSTRVQNDVSSGMMVKYIDILKTENEINSYKLLMLLGMEVGLVALVLIVVKCQKNRKKGVFFLTGFVLFVLPIVFENVDLILNGGSYNFYVMRNGFLIAFFLCIAGAYYFSSFDSTDEKEKNKILSYLKPVVAIIALYIEIPYYFSMSGYLGERTSLNDNGPMIGLSKLYIMGTAFLVGAVCIALIMLIKSKKIRTCFLIFVMVFVMCINVYRIMGTRENYSSDDNTEINKSEEYILKSMSIYDDVKNDDPFMRISVPAEEIYMNYPVLLERTAVSDWSHIVSGKLRETFYYLGYGMVFTSLSDTGATAFANALLGVSDSVSTVRLNKDLYSSTKKLNDGFVHYENRYSLPFGVIFGKEIMNVDFKGNFFDYQNRIFENMTDDKDLFSPVEMTDKKIDYHVERVASRQVEAYEYDKDSYVGTFTYHVGEKSVLYFYLDDGSDISLDDIVVDDCTIDINGERLIIPNYYDVSSEIYRIGNNNNILELGTFENEDVTIELNSTHPEIDKPVVYAMSLDKLDNLCKNYKSCVSEYSVGKRSFDIKATGEKGKYLFVPVYNNGSWVCTVNGEKTEVKNVLGSFMAIELQDGENDIRIKYVPQRYYINIAISAAALIGFVLIMLLIRKKQIKAPETLQRLFLWALTGLFSAFVTVAYIIPLIAQVYYLFVGRE